MFKNWPLTNGIPYLLTIMPPIIVYWLIGKYTKNIINRILLTIGVMLGIYIVSYNMFQLYFLVVIMTVHNMVTLGMFTDPVGCIKNDKGTYDCV